MPTMTPHWDPKVLMREREREVGKGEEREEIGRASCREIV